MCWGVESQQRARPTKAAAPATVEMAWRPPGPGRGGTGWHRRAGSDAAGARACMRQGKSGRGRGGAGGGGARAGERRRAGGGRGRRWEVARRAPDGSADAGEVEEGGEQHRGWGSGILRVGHEVEGGDGRPKRETPGSGVGGLRRKEVAAGREREEAGPERKRVRVWGLGRDGPTGPAHSGWKGGRRKERKMG